MAKIMVAELVVAAEALVVYVVRIETVKIFYSGNIITLQDWENTSTTTTTTTTVITKINMPPLLEVLLVLRQSRN